MNNVITIDTRQFEAFMTDWERKQVTFAMAKTLTGTAKKAQTAIIAGMKAAFDRPTPFTLGSTFVIPATKNNLVAEVKLKDTNQKGMPPTVWLGPQVYGGPRQPKRSEQLLLRKGILPSGLFWMPGFGAKLDSYGNVSRGQMSQILSAVSGFGETGFLANKSFRRGARLNKTTSDIFVGLHRNGFRGPEGIYLRTSKGHDVPLMIFITQPNYKARLPFQSIVQQVYVANFQNDFNDALLAALAGAS